MIGGDGSGGGSGDFGNGAGHDELLLLDGG
jgi:hypothetical protein